MSTGRATETTAYSRRAQRTGQGIAPLIFLAEGKRGCSWRCLVARGSLGRVSTEEEHGFVCGPTCHTATTTMERHKPPGCGHKPHSLSIKGKGSLTNFRGDPVHRQRQGSTSVRAQSCPAEQLFPCTGTPIPVLALSSPSSPLGGIQPYFPLPKTFCILGNSVFHT